MDISDPQVPDPLRNVLQHIVDATGTVDVDWTTGSGGDLQAEAWQVRHRWLHHIRIPSPNAGMGTPRGAEITSTSLATIRHIKGRVDGTWVVTFAHDDPVDVPERIARAITGLQPLP